MFDKLLIHESTKLGLLALAASPPHGILFVGPEGIGKMTVAGALAAQLTQHPTDIRTISPDERGTIAIETIRNLYKTSRTKQEGRQVVIIERADRMSIEAENAFLKLLEEPRDGLVFMLTAPQRQTLLPTILSRTQSVSLAPLPDEAIRRLVMNKRPGIAQTDALQIIFLAQGRPGIALNLLEGDALPAQRQRMTLVKQLIAAPHYQRYLLAGKLAGNREDCLETLNAMARVVEAQLSGATTAPQADHWSRLADALQHTQQAITNNGNVRAQLLYLFSRY